MKHKSIYLLLLFIFKIGEKINKVLSYMLDKYLKNWVNLFYVKKKKTTSAAA